MGTLLERKLILVTGKGGVGKTTVTAGLGMAASRRGLRTIVVELGGRSVLPGLFGADRGELEEGEEIELGESLWSISIDPDRALAQWLATLTGRLSARMITSRASFQYFAAAAPGARELLSMVKVWELTQQPRWQGRDRGYDLVILDAPATGHALALLGSPKTFGAIARVGPLATQARQVTELLEDPARSGVVAVARPSELAVTETLELAEGLREQLGRGPDAVVVNGMLSRRFSEAELARIAAVDGGEPLVDSALQAARSVSERSRLQRNQLARLRRRGLATVTLPMLFVARLEFDSLERIAERLADKLLGGDS